MQQNLLEEYTDFVDKVTSEASKSSDKMRERINYLNSKDIEMSRLLTAGIGLSGEVGEFNEIIKSRYRDNFSYASFSEGEKMRIDLALMFTWREIARFKNSANTNLLILDEVFDSSLDAAGTDEFMKMLNTLTENTNAFVISHKGDILYDKFDYVVVSTGHFSVPFIPEYKGMSSFPGRIMHSHDFRDAEEFRDKNVVVLGSSYSAEDVALQCHKYGAKTVTIGYRNNPMGFNWPEGMKEVHYMDKIDGNKAVFKDGTVQEMDALILCTGYLHHFPFLPEDLKLKTHNRLYPPNLYKGVVWQNNQNLFLSKL